MNILDINIYEDTFDSKLGTLFHAILEKYNYHAPYTGDINNYNTYLHELLRHIGEDFMEEVHIDNKINGVITRETKQRY